MGTWHLRRGSRRLRAKGFLASRPIAKKRLTGRRFFDFTSFRSEGAGSAAGLLEMR